MCWPKDTPLENNFMNSVESCYGPRKHGRVVVVWVRYARWTPRKVVETYRLDNTLVERWGLRCSHGYVAYVRELLFGPA